LAGATFFAGCGDSSDFETVSGQQGPAGGGLSPIARADAYAAIRNQALSINGVAGVLANDTVNADLSRVTTTFPGTTAQGGTITATDNSGAFTYTPAAGFAGTDTFSYTLANGFGSATATVTITVDAAVVTQGFFVDSVNGNDATGSFATGLPFRTIGAAVNAAGANTDIVVRPGNYTGAVNLLNGQRLLGSGSALVNAQGAARPVLTGPVVLADGNTVDFLRIAGTAGDAIDGDDQNGGTVTNCEMANTTNVGSGVQARSVRGTWTISRNTMSSMAGLGVELTAETGDVTSAQVNGNTITGNAFNALGFQSSNDASLRVQANDNVMTGNQRGFTFEVIAGGTSTATFQILGNRNDDTYIMSGTSTSTATIRVERLSQLIALNNNMGTVTTSGGSRPPVEVPAGTAGF
jgi:hypothetical protein